MPRTALPAPMRRTAPARCGATRSPFPASSPRRAEIERPARSLWPRAGRGRANTYVGRLLGAGLDDLARVARRLALGKRVDMLHAVGDFAPDGVLAVEEGRIVEADEELAVRAVRIHRPRHRAGAADMRLAAELGLEVGLLRAAGAGAAGIAALRHEPVDHAVEDDAVVEAAIGEAGDPLDMAGCEIGAQPDRHVARIERQGEGVVLGHLATPGMR